MMARVMKQQEAAAARLIRQQQAAALGLMRFGPEQAPGGRLKAAKPFWAPILH